MLVNLLLAGLLPTAIISYVGIHYMSTDSGTEPSGANVKKLEYKVFDRFASEGFETPTEKQGAPVKTMLVKKIEEPLKNIQPIPKQNLIIKTDLANNEDIENNEENNEPLVEDTKFYNKKRVVKELCKISQDSDIEVIEVSRDLIDNIEATIVDLKNNTFRQPVFQKNAMAMLMWFIKYVTATVYNKLTTKETITSKEIVAEAQKEAKDMLFIKMFDKEVFVEKIAIPYISTIMQ